uniref:Uracil-DNA glycosylase-like domain-containing protein n=1 Tax=viral metagenome TaxID=1070528 RepID=A0A6C0CF72_9ZZZZ
MEEQVVAKDVAIFQPSRDFDMKRFEVIILDMIPLSWRILMDNHEKELRDVATVLKRLAMVEKQVICPQPWNIFRALSLTPWYDVKVVIIGQDPYHQVDGGIPSATGCCFECREGDPIRKSLENVFIVLKKTIPGFEMPASGELTKWSTQGVLLLNATLTTKSGIANEHADIWPFFAMRVLQFLSTMVKNVVYLLWGGPAKTYAKYITKSTNLVLTASHPVAQGSSNTFLKCNHFNEANDYLTKYGKKAIDWKLT